MILHHYTTLEALYSIINTGKLHFSDYKYCNDTSELIYGFESIFPLISDAIKEVFKIKDDNLIRDEFVQKLDIIKKSLDITGSAYLLSLCDMTNNKNKNDGLLSMWRAYSNDGTGIAIEFHADTYLNDVLILPKNQNFMLEGKITYGTNKKKFIEEIVKNRCEIYKNLKEAKTILPKCFMALIYKSMHMEFENMDEYIGEIFYIFSISMFFKHGGFSEENEYRVLISNNNVKFKTVNQNIKPYLEIKFNLSKIKKIIIGSNLKHSDENILSTLRKFLDKKNMRHIDISMSGIPYRNI